MSADSPRDPAFLRSTHDFPVDRQETRPYPAMPPRAGPAATPTTVFPNPSLRSRASADFPGGVRAWLRGRGRRGPRGCAPLDPLILALGVNAPSSCRPSGFSIEARSMAVGAHSHCFSRARREWSIPYTVLSVLPTNRGRQRPPREDSFSARTCSLGSFDC